MGRGREERLQCRQEKGEEIVVAEAAADVEVDEVVVTVAAAAVVVRMYG